MPGRTPWRRSSGGWRSGILSDTPLPGRTGDAPLRGAGSRTPIFFSVAPKRKRPFTVKRKDADKQPGTGPRPCAGLLSYGGCRGRYPCNLIVSCRVRPTQAEQRQPAAASQNFRLAFGVVNEWSLLLFPLPLPFRGGKSKGEGPRPLPFVSLGGVGETDEAPPVADEASLFRGSGAIGGPKGAGNRNAATVFEVETPPRFWRGSKGEVSLRQRHLPFFLPSPLLRGEIFSKPP